MQKQGATHEEATSNFWINDAEGLITSGRADLPDNVKPFARRPGDGDTEGEALLQVVKRVSARQITLHTRSILARHGSSSLRRCAIASATRRDDRPAGNGATRLGRWLLTDGGKGDEFQCLHIMPRAH